MHTIQIDNNKIILANETHRAEILLFGGILNRFEILQQNGEWFNAVNAYTDTEAAKHIDSTGFHSAKLSPFVCRLREGKFTFKDKSYLINKTMNGVNAIHGIMYDAQYSVSGSLNNPNKVGVTIRTEYAKQVSGFPFDMILEVKYVLKNNSLSIETRVRNTGEESFPLADGWHLYFQLGGSVDDWTLQINSATQLEFDEQLIPTGKQIADERFHTAASLRDVELDNCFILENYIQAACTLKNSQFTFQIFPEDSYPYLQVYIPNDRKSIALENLSAAPDAFNNKIGLLELAAGEKASFKTRYELSSN